MRRPEALPAACLTAKKQRLQELGVNVPIDIFVREGRAETVITDLSRREPDRLIVMSTHERGGLSRLVMGSVTARVVGSASNPTLIVRGGSSDGVRVGRSPDNIIVPLDGSAFAEHALLAPAPLRGGEFAHRADSKDRERDLMQV